MERLDLDDPRWGVLTPREWKAFDDGIREIVLHQMTITNGSLAFVPWLMHVYATRETEYRWAYIADIAAIEANRISHGLYYNREGTEEYPDWLMAQYQKAVASAALVAADLVQLDRENAWECGLLSLMPAFQGDGKLAWEQWRQRYNIS